MTAGFSRHKLALPIPIFPVLSGLALQAGITPFTA
jgi:hypothetical protein